MTTGLLRQITPPGPTLRFQWNPDQYARQLGVGGWAEVPHPRRKSSTEWQGLPLHRVSLDLLFDAARARKRDVEPELHRLYLMSVPIGWKVGQPAPSAEPPVLAIDWAEGRSYRWVVNNIEWQHVARDPDTNRRVQARVRLDLLEYVAAEITATPVAKAQAATSGAAAPAAARTYTVKGGDTLSGIAAKQLGDHKKWPKIAELNGIRDPRRLQIGQKLRLPA